MGIQLNLAEVRKNHRQSLGDSARDAEAAWREQMRRKAIDSAHFFGLAALYDERGKPELAAECLEIAASKEIVNPYVHKLNGKLLFRDKDYDRAGRELRRAQRYNPFILPGERNGDAVTLQNCELIRLDPTQLEVVIDEHPDLGVQVFWGFWHGLAQKLRSANEQLRTFFSEDSLAENLDDLRHCQPETGAIDVGPDDKLELFREQGLSGTELETLASFSNVKRYPGGTFLFREGDKGHEMYVVLEGRVMISKFIPGGGEEALAILDRGDFFGEMSLIDGEPRSADAKAFKGPVTVVTFDDETLGEIMAMDPRAARSFMVLLCRLICQRMREIDEKITGWRIMAGVHPHQVHPDVKTA